MSNGRWFGTVVCGLLAVATVVWIRSGKSAAHYEKEGRAALTRRDVPAAVEALESAVKAAPEQLSAWKSLADAASRNGQPDRAYEALEVVARLAPDDANSLCLQLGGRWMASNQIQPAIRALRLATVANPRPPQPYRLLAQIYGVTGYRREVVRCLVELLKRREFTRNDLIVLSSVNPSLDDPARLQLIRSAAPEDKSVLLPQAMQALDKNHIEEAQRLLLEITTADPVNYEAQSILGELYADFQPERFLDWHARLTPEAEQDARIWLARGKWLHSMGQSASAVRCLHETVTREPENLTATALLGQLLKSLGDLEQGNAFTERGRRLQKIIDLGERIKEPRGNESIPSMIEELEATGRLWEAWGWCVIAAQDMPRRNETLIAAHQRLEAQLQFNLPRTIPTMLPGRDHNWQRYPLPNWSQLKSQPVPSATTASESTAIRFEDQSEHSGLDFRYINTQAQASGHKIYETMGAGVAALDYDQDGWQDLYFPQGKPLPLDSIDGPNDALFRNQSGERFLSVTVATGIHETSYSQGVAAGDYDNDGFPDLYVANLGRNRLYHNNGDGTFTDVTEAAGIQQDVWTVSCAIADLNGDGLPELFDVNYVQGPELLTATCFDPQRRPVVCRPTVFDPVPDTVSLNLGDGRFQPLQQEAGLDLPQGMGLGLVIADYNDDDRLDVFIANDMTANFLLIHDSPGPMEPLRFRDEAFLRGVALDVNGLAQACMGVGSADVNRDGRPDLFVTNFARESNTLYLSQPGGLYQDQTQSAGLREPSFDPLGFGTQFLDADQDGWFDLVVMNGHIDEFVNEPFRMQSQFFRGHSNGRFTELKTQQVGRLFDQPRLARGLALLDWNRDGRMDFVATDLERPALLAENQTETPHHSLRLKLVGTSSSRDAIGAKIRVLVGPNDERVCQMTAGDGYESSNERLVQIGVGTTDTVTRVEIRWPSGVKSEFTNISCHQNWLAIEGRAVLIPQSPE